MRKMLLATLVAISTATPALADAWDFVLTNSTGKEIKLVEVSPSGTGAWQKNVVDEERKATILRNGVRTTVHFDKAAKQCSYDLKATFADDSTAVWSKINVCDNAFVTLKYGPAGTPLFTAN